MRLPCVTLLLLLVLLTRCRNTLGEGNGTRNVKEPEDQPMSVSLSQQLVARRNESIPSSTSSSLFMEGGSVNNKSTQAVPVVVDPKKLMLPPNATHDMLPVEGAMAVSWPEGQDKNSNIKPRKGVSTNIDDIGSITTTPCACCVNITSEELLKNCLCCPPDFKISFSTVKPKILTENTTSKILKDTANVSISVTSTSTAIPTKSSIPLTVVPSPISHHHKPNVTADVPDQQVPAQQEDYVIPVVGIIFAIPLAIILGALVYKKGADLWERRHYRRMDFLIDGIYNQ